MNQLLPIGHIYTDFPEKFGIPRQSTLANLTGTIIMEPPYRTMDAFKGITDYDYIWLIWGFSENDNIKCNMTVKPPRLGGNTHVGVFASRAPFRPNGLGLSLVKLEELKLDEKLGPILTVNGIDMLNKTPIYDIKPYLPHIEAHPLAKGGFSYDVKDYKLNVSFSEELLSIFPKEKRDALIEILSEDPRPSYHNDPERQYGVAFAGYDVHFTVKDDTLTVFEVIPYGK